jgi:(1->4)-alpha-D-glucan 1-alpha-D-glucosylmutase
VMRTAIERARDKTPELWYEIRLIEKYLSSEPDDDLAEDARSGWLEFVMRFQQTTGPLTAKGFEDTVFYVYNRFLALNEVGGQPGLFGLPLSGFHAFNLKRAAHWPQAMNATATHDTKRGEDVRARLNVLSEIPAEWGKHLRLWSRLNRKAKRMVKGAEAPDRNDEYFLYQTLLGAFPFDEGEYPVFRERLGRYLVKAVREAKVHTAWLKPEADYEEAYLSFASALLPADGGGRFLKEFRPFQKRLAFFGVINSLSQTALKMFSPGVPDFYQGTELWDFSLVDPDNRRPVDYGKRRAMLAAIRGEFDSDAGGLCSRLLQSYEDGRVKMFLTWRGLEARRKYPGLFLDGGYRPLETRGRHAENVVAFERGEAGGRVRAVTVVPRFLTGLVHDGAMPLGKKTWEDTAIVLPEAGPRRWRNGLTGRVLEADGVLPLGDALCDFPVALLVNEEET